MEYFSPSWIQASLGLYPFMTLLLRIPQGKSTPYDVKYKQTTRVSHGQQKIFFSCLLTNSLLREIISELVKKPCFQPQNYVKMCILLQYWLINNSMPGSSKQMLGKVVYFQIRMTFTVPLCCIRFLVYQVGGELRNYFKVNCLHKDGQSRPC